MAGRGKYTELEKRMRSMTDAQKLPLFHCWVDRSGGPDACWEWRGKRNKAGYGVMAMLGENVAYRIAYRLAKGPIEPGKIIMHSCDNPPCCNPAHLSQGTHADNMADKIAKGRQWKGGAKPKSRRAS